jgi:hypothetical protein
MKIGENLDFCIIKNPFSNEHRFLIFFTRKGKIDIDSTLAQDETYEKIRYVMSNFGMDEVDILTFESSPNVIKTFEIEVVNKKLQEIGFSYSKDFEKALLDEIQHTFKSEDSYLTKNENNIVPIIEKKQYLENSKLVSANSSSVYKIPELGEKMVLYFYLFLECRFSKNGEGYLDVNGDFNKREDTNSRNFLKIVKSEFVRIPSPNPNQIILQSIKNYSDFIKENSVIHKGVFKLAKPFQDSFGSLKIGLKEYYYNLIEIRKNIKPDEKITIEVNIDYYFDYMMDMSKRIRREHLLDSKKQISKEHIISEINLMKDKFSSKMEDLAEKEEYEKASEFKKLVEILNKKLTIANSIETENINQRDFYKHFSLV